MSTLSSNLINLETLLIPKTFPKKISNLVKPKTSSNYLKVSLDLVLVAHNKLAKSVGFSSKNLPMIGNLSAGKTPSLSTENLTQNLIFQSVLDKIKLSQAVEWPKELVSKFSHNLNKKSLAASSQIDKLEKLKKLKNSENSKVANLDVTLTQSQTVIAAKSNPVLKPTTLINFSAYTKPASCERRFLLLQNQPLSEKSDSSSKIAKSTSHNQLDSLSQKLSQPLLQKWQKINNSVGQLHAHRQQNQIGWPVKDLNLNQELKNWQPQLAKKLIIAEQKIGHLQRNLVQTMGYLPTGFTYFSDIKKLPDLSYLNQKTTQIYGTAYAQAVKAQDFIKLMGVLIISFLRQLWESLSWQNFLLWAQTTSLFQSLSQNKVLEKWSVHSGQFQKNLDNFGQFFQASLTRDFWWLEIKLETRKLQIQIWQKLQSIYRIIWFLTKKLYLVIFTILALIGLSFGPSWSNNQLSVNSLQAKNNPRPIQFDTVYVQAQASVIDFRSFSPNSQSVSAISSDQTVKKIIAHPFGANDTVAKLAELYNLSISTIKFNNQLGEGEPEIGKILYLPWQNGYILHTTSEISAKDLAKTYGLEEQLIIDTNQAFWNSKNSTFAKETLLLIPTTDFAQIEKTQKEEKARQNNLLEATKQRDKMLNYTAITPNDKDLKQTKKTGFIWPAVGSISRCVQPGHVACDIANFSGPPIFAVQDATVIEAGWKDGGFGYMALLDHGQGLQTMYMHMDNIYVARGQKLQQGQAIGKMGCTGNCSGTHLHFEVRQNRVLQNPLLYLP